MLKLLFIVLCSTLLASCTAQHVQEIRKIPEDALLTVPALIRKHGYPAEVHYVQTEDGYILQLHRIPNGRTSSAGSHQKRKPVFLQHGLLASSADYILAGPTRSIGFILADLGYDVWMANSRGTKYSRNHTILNPNKAKFWEFTFHEIGIYDNPAMIDYILEETKEEKLFYFGYSQGTTTFFVMTSEKPEYNDKIQAMVGLGPAAYIGHMKNPLIKFLSRYVGNINFLLKLIGVHEFLPQTKFLTMFGGELCSKESPFKFLCANVFFILCGFNPEQMDLDLIPVILGHTPAGSSTKQFLHYAQLLKTDKFRQYDFGVIKNLIKYKRLTPPRYDISKITVPVALWYSHNDILVDEKDVLRLYSELPNPAGLFLVSDKKFSHTDYLYAKNVVEVVYNDVTKYMNNF